MMYGDNENMETQYGTKFVPRKQAGSLTLKEGVVLVAVPLIVFVFGCGFLLLVMGLPAIALIFTVLVVLAVAHLTYSQWASGREPKLGLFVMLAIFECYCTTMPVHAFYFSPYWKYVQSHTYTNVIPSEPAAGFADAGRLTFIDGAHIDSSRVLGYNDGATYCVAPIMDENLTAVVQFWAVGMNCCARRANFFCDDAWDEWARSGVVIHHSGDANLHEKYYSAIGQATSAFEMITVPDPMLVRWVVDPDEVEGDLWGDGLGILVIAGVLHLVINVIFVAALYGKRLLGFGGCSQWK